MEVIENMITLSVLIAFLAFVVLALSLCVIFGGVGGILIVADVTVFLLCVGLVLKVIFDR